jgi:twinkle protein
VASNFAQLMASFGDKPDRTFSPSSSRAKITYVKPRTNLSDVSDLVKAYLTNVRGFSESTIIDCDIKSDSENNVVFTYNDTLDGKTCLLKFRLPRKIDPAKNERKAWRERGGKDVLWRLEKASPSHGPLVICLGEYDAMSCVEAEIPNATSVPSGDDSLDWIKNDWDELEKYSDIVLWCDDDQSGQRAMGEIARRLGIHRVRVVESMFKDANATLYYLRKQEGDEAIPIMQRLVENAPAYPFEHLIRLIDVQDEQMVFDGIMTGISELDAITGGFSGGGLTIWSGDNHAGKTTGVLGLCVVEPIQQGVPTFIYSGEMKKSKIKYWCELIAAGPRFLEERLSKRTGRTYWEVNELAKWNIRDWYADLVHLYDKQGGTSEENLFDAMEFAYKKHGCKNFVLDNLMIMILSMSDAQNEYHRQAVFTKHCKQFADDFDVHVHLVAHGKKGGDINMPPTKSDIKGASEISNLADNAGAFWRVPETARHGGLEEVDSMLCWFKTRDSGEQANIKLLFDKPSKRMTELKTPHLVERMYSWEEKLEISQSQTETDS